MSRATHSTHSIDRGSSEGFETWTLASSEAELEATFAPHAGMIGCSLRHRGEELLEQGNGIAGYAASGATFGIPLLYPWANRLAASDYTAAGATLAARLDFAAHPDLLAAFPFPHEVRIDVLLAGSELSLATTVTARDLDVPVAFGYHPYLRIPGIPRERWQIELPVREHLALDDRMIPTGAVKPVSYEPAPLGARSFDDGYAMLEPGRPFAVEGARRRIEVRFGERFPFAQVYSPPGAQFICFEPMTAPTNALRSGDELPVARAGESFAATWSIRVIEPGPRRA